MGALRNILIRMLSTGLLVLLAGAAFADEPASEAPGSIEAAVSMSPAPFEGDSDRTNASRVQPSPHPLPLTRAATQQHIDDMSPVGWLASFGPVTVGNGQP